MNYQFGASNSKSLWELEEMARKKKYMSSVVRQIDGRKSLQITRLLLSVLSMSTSWGNVYSCELSPLKDHDPISKGLVIRM